MNGWTDLGRKVVILTGGASGIGAAIAETLHANNAFVVVCDRNANDAILRFTDTFITCDVTNGDSVRAMVDEVFTKYGRIDALVNNAGVNRPRLLVDIFKKNARYEATEADFDFIVAVNQKGPFLCTQAVARHMLEQGGGVVVNLCSAAGVEGSVGQSLYSSTKAGLNGFTRSWAKELGPYNIRVVGIAPDVNKRTNMNNDENYAALAYSRGLDPNHIDDDYTSSIPLGRAGEHSEIADLVTYLVSDHASYITGTTISIAGGKSR